VRDQREGKRGRGGREGGGRREGERTHRFDEFLGNICHVPVGGCTHDTHDEITEDLKAADGVRDLMREGGREGRRVRNYGGFEGR